MDKVCAILLCLCVSVGANLMCYDCDPTSPGRCRDPVHHNVKVTHCPESRNMRCFSIHYTPSEYKMNQNLSDLCF
ncbi:hypothetical protein Zmor_027280 [Zophobas morio]|uniref:Uncharacterized protein n=1 Tax=Zophobas morio TaxID=2755281 RepID=A0AA38M1Y0_9CUCU|nr:hypothetical protein Zmor_027274 [Zophobas morio]KAJ3640737.1 hypothetical protein Zmor_027280 [Zophobas morio]